MEWPKLLLRASPNFVLKSAQPGDKPGLTLVGAGGLKKGKVSIGYFSIKAFYNMFTEGFFLFPSLGVADCE